MPAATAAAVNATHRGGGHVIAIGTTVVRALETVTDRAGTVHPGEGWTDLVVIDARTWRPSRRRPADRLARAGGDPPGDARGHRRTASRSSPPTSRRSPPGTAGTSSATATSSFPTLDRDDRGWTRFRRPPRAGVAVAPPIPVGRRAVLYAVRRIGDATVEDVAERPRHHRRPAPASTSPRSPSTDSSRRSRCATTRRGGVGRGSPTTSASSATCCFPKAYGALTNELLGYVAEFADGAVDRLFERRRDHRIASASDTPGPAPIAGRQGRRADGDPRRGRLPRLVRPAQPRPLPRRRAQLRDRRRRRQLRPGMLQRARVHPRRAARGRRHAGEPHGQRRSPLRLRRPPPAAARRSRFAGDGHVRGPPGHGPERPATASGASPHATRRLARGRRCSEPTTASCRPPA